MEKDDKGSTMTRMGVSGWMFLLVPAYPGCPGSKAVKRSLLLVSVLCHSWWGNTKANQPVKTLALIISKGSVRDLHKPRQIFLNERLNRYCICMLWQLSDNSTHLYDDITYDTCPQLVASPRVLLQPVTEWSLRCEMQHQWQRIKTQSQQRHDVIML